ncbi:MAG TPA: xanthine dehydrogenase family protein molybdopterin-binding subunit, partial [Acidimicrobiia bacterium]|nr:xanthine dehydrogenase family protein molybdopterin-binding subunit [Acidimicrobiia bacterium]
LAVDRVRHVGDPVAIVVADSRRLAEDACELIEVDYQPLPPISTVEQALDADRAVVWPKSKTNVHYQTTERWGGDVDAAFAAADRVVVETFHQHRHSNQPMETRGILAEIDPGSGEMTVHASTQSAHQVKWCMALLTGRRPIGQVLRQMVRQKDHTKAIFAGMGAYLKATPAMVGALKEMAPVMLKQNVTNLERTKAMNLAIVGLIGRDPTTLPAALAGDVGGAFGAKSVVHREDVAVCAAALELGQSVKWTEDRNEHLTVGAQAREESIELAVALRHDGTILGKRARMTMDGGAYPGFPFGAAVAARLVRTMFPGPYRVPALEFHTRILTSNKATYVFYRGPWAVECFVRERMLDVIAAELGLTRDEIRRRNLIGPDELPTKMVTGPALDVRMSARRVFEKAMDVAGVDDWEKTKAEALAEGRRLGLGFASYIEAAPGPPGYMDNVAPGFSAMVDCEPINAVLEADGTVTVLTQQVTNGQSHETTLAQLAADQLGVPMEAVRVSYGDTRTAPFGLVGTAGSRSATLASGAVLMATKGLRDRIVDLAADLLEAAPSDIVIEDGRIHVTGTPAIAVSLADVADAARGLHQPPPSGARGTAKNDEAIRVTEIFDGGAGGWSIATHVCFVEIDLETGQVKIPRYIVVEDCGELINPAVVEGQIRGGVAQGVGAVLYEKSTYDDQGQFQAGTFMDYLIPTAMEIPEIEIHHVETPSDVFANFRGVGEGGMIGAPPAITNAIEDALSDLGVRITEQHLPPARILELAGVIPVPTH